jgi:hypothetical protein
LEIAWAERLLVNELTALAASKDVPVRELDG